MGRSRVETLLGSILTGEDEGIEKPASRVEELLKGIYDEGGGGGGEGDVKMVSGTTEYWATHGSEISVAKTMYIYTDYDQDDYGKNVPAFKIGDGITSISNLSFVASAGIDQQDVDKWNTNVSVDSNELTEETLSLI